MPRFRTIAAAGIRVTLDLRVAPSATDLEERLFKEAGQDSEKANVVDYVADR